MLHGISAMSSCMDARTKGHNAHVCGGVKASHTYHLIFICPVYRQNPAPKGHRQPLGLVLQATHIPERTQVDYRKDDCLSRHTDIRKEAWKASAGVTEASGLIYTSLGHNTLRKGW